MQLLLFPASSKLKYINYVQTVEYSININEITEICDKKNVKILQEIKSKSIHIWGVPDGHNKKDLGNWKKSKVGDSCLFYRNKKFFSKSKIILKLIDENIASRFLVKTAKGDLSKNLFILEPASEISISNYRFNKALNKINSPLNSFKIENIKNKSLLKELGISTLKTLTGRREDFYQGRLHELEKLDGIKSQAKIRLEQDIFTEFLFSDCSNSKCAICSRSYPNSIMVAGHIKKRSLSSDIERRNLKNVMPICKMGCDDLFERGYIYIDKKGFIRRNNEKEITSDLNHYLNSIVDKKSWFFDKDNAIFFEQHRNLFQSNE